MLTRLLLLVACLAVPNADATELSVPEILRIHAAAIGGRERIAALQATRAWGRVTTPTADLPFTAIAAAPNRLRLEFTFSSGLLVQATDGTSAWELDTRRPPATARPLPQAAAAVLRDAADFGDPLVAAERNGDTIELAPARPFGGHTALAVLVTHHVSQSYFLLLDPATFWILARLDPPSRFPVTRGERITEYRDYRPVAGVLTPHGFVVRVDGIEVEHSTLDRIEPNPPLPADIFCPPGAAAPSLR